MVIFVRMEGIFSAAISGLVCWLCLRVLLSLPGLKTVNYLGEAVTGSAGLAVITGALSGWLSWLAWRDPMAVSSGSVNPDLLPTRQDPSAFLLSLSITCFCFSLVGLIDDIIGAEVRGFKGHFQTLLSQGKLTTGALKALAGGAVSVSVAIYWHGFTVSALLCALLIATFANFINLLDTRPGRALKGFWLSCLVVFGSVGLPTVFLFGPVLASSLVYAPSDFRRRALLGDAGSNPLGACIGLVAGGLSPQWVQIVLLVALVAFHVYAEKRSLTEDIPKLPVLNWLDRLGT